LTGLLERVLSTPPFTALGLLPVVPAARADGQPAPAALPGAPGFRLVTNNGQFGNRKVDGWAAAVLDLDPGVLVVQEAADPLVEALERAGVRDALPHAFVDPARARGGCVLYSRTPLAGGRLVDGAYGGASATIELGGTTVTVVGAHPKAPVAPWDERPWRDSFRAVAAVVDAAPGPVVCAGDWNATMWHEPLRGLLDHGLDDAHPLARRARAATWPAPLPVALLDRVLVRGLAVRAITEAVVPGSDHRAVVADLAIMEP
jgi:endonuclease/exonuclease/phosphatase (EEP) superfamily protein YafD